MTVYRRCDSCRRLAHVQTIDLPQNKKMFLCPPCSVEFSQFCEKHKPGTPEQELAELKAHRIKRTPYKEQE